jgi:ribosomal protein L44E
MKEVRNPVGRRGIKEYRPPEALALIAADREHEPLYCPSCRTRTIERVPRRRNSVPRKLELSAERISLTCRSCGRHAFYVWAQVQQIQASEQFEG